MADKRKMRRERNDQLKQLILKILEDYPEGLKCHDITEKIAECGKGLKTDSDQHTAVLLTEFLTRPPYDLVHKHTNEIDKKTYWLLEKFYEYNI